MTKIFVTGATGYIGGDALYAIANAHPEYEITCLVRNSEKGAQVVKDNAKVKLVYGDLDSVKVLEEAKKADIVCRESLFKRLTTRHLHCEMSLTRRQTSPTPTTRPLPPP